MDAGEILDFWFAEECRKCWFNSTDALDSSIKERFMDVWQAARNGELSSWQESAEGCLALVIILDQFPLNMFRGKAESFSTEAAAREVAKYAIEQGLDKSLNNDQRLFLYLPFMHSENMADQDQSVALFQSAGMETRWAEHHRDIVRSFGRFPHRNAILGRESSEQELAYLNSKESFKG